MSRTNKNSSSSTGDDGFADMIIAIFLSIIAVIGLGIFALYKKFTA